MTSAFSDNDVGKQASVEEVVGLPIYSSLVRLVAPRWDQSTSYSIINRSIINDGKQRCICTYVQYILGTVSKTLTARPVSYSK